MERYANNSCWAAEWPKESWGPFQDRMIAAAKFFGLEWSKNLDFWSRSDGQGRIEYGTNISQELRAAFEREREMAAAYDLEKTRESYERAVLFCSPEQTYLWATVGCCPQCQIDPFFHYARLRDLGWRYMGKAKELIRFAALADVTDRIN